MFLFSFFSFFCIFFNRFSSDFFALKVEKRYNFVPLGTDLIFGSGASRESPISHLVPSPSSSFSFSKQILNKDEACARPVLSNSTWSINS